MDGSANTCAEVMVSPSEDFVCGSNRGHYSIATFVVARGSGQLSFLVTTASGGHVPRSFTLTAGGKVMLVANESGNVDSFAVNPTSGALTPLHELPLAGAPQFVGVVRTPRANVSP